MKAEGKQMIVKAFFDTSEQFYPVYWSGKSWVKNRKHAKVYKRFPSVVGKLRKSCRMADDNVHSVEVR